MLQDFLSFDRYLTPSLIRIFYILQLALVLVVFLSGLFGALVIIATASVIGGLFYLLAILIGCAVGVIAVRIVTELVMVLFQNNEHLAALRARTEGGTPAA